MKKIKNKIKMNYSFNKIIFFLILFFIITCFIIFFRLDLFFLDIYEWDINLGNKYYSIHNFDKALKYSNKAINIGPAKAEAHILKGKIYLKKRLYNLAEKEFQNLEYHQDPEMIKEYSSLMGKLRLYQGRLNESKSFYFEVLKLYPKGYISLGRLGIISYLRSDINNTIKYFKESLRNMDYYENTRDKEIMRGLIHAINGFILDSQGQYKKAEGEYRKARSYYYYSIEEIQLLINSYDSKSYIGSI